MTDSKTPILLTEQEVSRLTSIPLNTLRGDRFKRQGFSYVKKGRSIRYRLSDIQDYLEQHTIHPERRGNQ